MSIANSSAFLWAALIVPIVIFYILKIRLRRIPVSTVIFWQQIFEEKKPRSLWQKLRHLISLLLQIAFICLLVGALAEPYLRSEFAEARRVVLVVDNSASMNATDIAPSRLTKAKELGANIIAGLRFRDEMAIVAAGTQPQVVCGLTGHQRTLRDALETVTPSDGPTRVTEAIALARRLIAEQKEEQKRVQVVVLTDGCAEGIEKLAEAEDVRLVPVGERTGNVAITRFQVRRSLLDPIGYEILAEVVNHSDEPVECRFEIDLNGDAVDVVPLKLATNDKWSKVIEKASADGGLLTARLKHEDALAADNEARALLPKREFQPVLLVSAEPHLFLEKVLEANPLVKLSGARRPQAASPGTIAVYHRVTPNPLPPGPILVIDPANDTDLWQVGDKLQNPIVTKLDKESPLMAHVRLDNVLMPEARKLTFNASAKPHILAGALTGEPLYAAIERPEGKVLILTVNLDQGDLPLRTAFPIMATNALAWFAGEKGELREALAAGATTEVTLPTASGEFLLRAPDGRTRRLPPGVGKTTIGPLDQCGIWSVVPDDPGAKPLVEIACNMANATESDIRPPESLPSATADGGVAAGFMGRPIWFYLIALAWLLAGWEWYLYQRRWIS